MKRSLLRHIVCAILIVTCTTPLYPLDTAFVASSEVNAPGVTSLRVGPLYFAKTSGSFTTLEFFSFTGIAKDLQFHIYIPIILRATQIKDVCDRALGHYTSAGLSDMEFYLRYRFLHKPLRRFEAHSCFQIGALVPSGDHCAMPALGLGTYDMTCYWLTQLATPTIELLTNIGAYLPVARTTGSSVPAYELSMGMAFRPAQFREHPTEDFNFLINITYTQSDSHAAGSENDPAPTIADGRTLFLLGPGLRYSHTNHDSKVTTLVEGAFQAPAYEKLRGNKHSYLMRWRIQAGIEF